MTTVHSQPQGLTLQDLSPEPSMNNQKTQKRNHSIIYDAPGLPPGNYENFETFNAIKGVHDDAVHFSNAKSPIPNKFPSHTDHLEARGYTAGVEPINAHKVNTKIQGLLQNCNDILRKSQGLAYKDRNVVSPGYEHPQLSQTVYVEPYSSLSMNFSDSALKQEGTATSLRYSASLFPHSTVVGNMENELSEIKSGGFTKRSYDYSMADSESPMRSDIQAAFHSREVYSARKDNDLFPIKESERSSVVSNGQDLREVSALKSRISNLEEKLNSLNDVKSTTLADKVLNLNHPPSRSFSRSNTGTISPYGGVTPNFSLGGANKVKDFPAPEHENPKKSSLIRQDSSSTNYISEVGYSPEKTYKTSLKIDTADSEDVSQRAVQNIDQLIQHHLFKHSHMTRSRVSQQQQQQPRSQYTSPTRTTFELGNPLYKSNVFAKTEQPASLKSSTVYDNYRSPTSYKPMERELRSTLPIYVVSGEPTPNKTQSYHSQSLYDTLPRSPPRYIRPLERSMASPNPINTLELTQPRYTNAFEESSPIVLAKPYDISSTYDTRPFESYKTGLLTQNLKSLDIRDSYDQNYPGGYQQSPSNSTQQNQIPENYRKTNAPFNSNMANDGTPSNGDINSDRKMKKLTLKARASEEKDPERREQLSASKKDLHSGDLLSDCEPSMFDFNAGEDPEHEVPQNKKFKAGDLLPDDDVVVQQVKFRAGEIEPDSGIQTQHQAQKSIASGPGAEQGVSGKINFNSGDLIPDQDDFVKQEFRAGELISVSTSPLKGILKSESTLKKASSATSMTGNFHAGDLLPDTDSPHSRTVKVGIKLPEKAERSRKVNFNAGDLLPDGEVSTGMEFKAGDLMNDTETPLTKVTRNVADDGKAWHLVHRLQSDVFESTDNSFQFEGEFMNEQREDLSKSLPAPKTIAPVPKKLNESVVPSKSQNRDGSKAHIWVVESSDSIMQGSLLKSTAKLSDSMKKAQKARLITHCFEKYGEMGL